MDLIPKNAVTLPFKLRPLSEQEAVASGGFNYAGRITADDLTVTDLDTVQDIVIMDIPIECTIIWVLIRLITPFQNTADSGYNTTTGTVQDDNSNTFISAQELNANGSPITAPVQDDAFVGPYPSGKHLIVEFGAQSGKRLSDINRGELHVFVQILDSKPLSDLTPKALISKP